MSTKPDENGVTDLTQDAGLEEPNDAELFANLSSRAPTSGLHKRPREALAHVARLGALVPSTASGRSVPPPSSSSGALSAAAAPKAAPAPALSTRPLASAIEGGAFEDDEPTPGRQRLPAPRRPVSRKTLAVAVAGAALLLFIVVVVAGRSIGRQGSLLVTATGPGSSEVTGVEVLVDGEKHCSTSPCKVASIAAGTHLVSVRAKGFQSTAALAVTVAASTESVLNVSLSPAASPAASTAAAIETPKPAQAAPAASPPVQAARKQETESIAPSARLATAATSPAITGQVPRSAPSAASPAAASAAAADTNLGTLRIVSLPVASVLLDGRPIGRTPQVVRVSPGQHRVAIVAGEDRRAQTVTVAPGGVQVVSVRF